MNDEIYRRSAPREDVVRVAFTARSGLVWAGAIALCALALALAWRPARWESAEVARAMSALFSVLSLGVCARGLRSPRVELVYDARSETLRTRVARLGRASEKRERVTGLDTLRVRELAGDEAVLVDRQGVERSVRVPRDARAAMGALLGEAQGPREPAPRSVVLARAADGALVLCALAASVALCVAAHGLSR